MLCMKINPRHKSLGYYSDEIEPANELNHAHNVGRIHLAQIKNVDLYGRCYYKKNKFRFEVILDLFDNNV